MFLIFEIWKIWILPVVLEKNKIPDFLGYILFNSGLLNYTARWLAKLKTYAIISDQSQRAFSEIPKTTKRFKSGTFLEPSTKRFDIFKAF